MALYDLYAQPPRMDRVMVMCLDGWIDAGNGAGGAMAALRATTDTELIASFDNDALIDNRARRPMVQITDGVLDGVTWPTIEVRAGVDKVGHGILLLTGPEPDMCWQEFCRDVLRLAADLSVTLTVGLGAFPTAVPHTRPIRLASTSSHRELADVIGFMPGTIEVPSGIHAVLEQAMADDDRRAMGVWARVPHYISNWPYPAASAAILDGLQRVSGIVVDTAELHAAAAVTQARVNSLIGNSEEHTTLLRQLEAQYDTEMGAELGTERAGERGGDRGAPGAGPLPDVLPSGDELAAELERFLRGETP